jgi:hypothetical protein
VIGATLVTSFGLGCGLALWILFQRMAVGAVPTRKSLVAPINVLVCLQAWIGGAGLGSLAVVQVYSMEASATEVALVARAALGVLGLWLPVAIALMVLVLRNLRATNAGVFVDLGSAMAYSFALVGWVASGDWRLAL